MANYFLSAIIELLNPDNTISAHRMLAHAIGMNETIIYSALISKQTYYARNSYLSECFIGFEEKWREILSEKEIKHRKAYMKSCIWLWLNEFEFEMYSDQVSGEAYCERG